MSIRDDLILQADYASKGLPVNPQVLLEAAESIGTTIQLVSNGKSVVLFSEEESAEIIETAVQFLFDQALTPMIRRNAALLRSENE